MSSALLLALSMWFANVTWGSFRMVWVPNLSDNKGQSIQVSGLTSPVIYLNIEI